MAWALLLGACTAAEPAVPARLAITTALVDAELYVDAHPRGPLVDGIVLELDPGPHVLEARRARTVVARKVVQVRSGDRRTEALDERPFRGREVPRGARRRD
ncbi:MAG: hypothetical protein U0230_12795 [Polyangiales bacterium]